MADAVYPEDALENYKNQADKTRHYTYADFLKWETNKKQEILDGILYKMAPPTVQHQTILMTLFQLFANWLEDKQCKVFFCPLDVRLFPKMDLSDNIVVQPDIFVVCNKEKIGKKSIDGAPDLVIEILSPSDSAQEMMKKFEYYQRSGVREYWIINPDEKKVQVNIFEEGKVLNSYYLDDEKISVAVLPGLEINLKDIWG